MNAAFQYRLEAVRPFEQCGGVRCDSRPRSNEVVACNWPLGGAFSNWFEHPLEFWWQKPGFRNIWALGFGAAGVPHQSPRSPNVPAFQTPPKFHEMIRRETKKKTIMGAGDGKKSTTFGALLSLRVFLLEGTDFGQSRFGHPDLTDFVQSNFGQSNPILNNLFLGSGVCHGGGPKGWGPRWVEGKKFRALFPLARIVVPFLPLWAPKPPGFHTTAREPKRAHLRVPVFKNTTKIQRKGPTREGDKNKNCGGRGKKKCEILGGPAEGSGSGWSRPTTTPPTANDNKQPQHSTTTQNNTQQHSTHNNTKK